MNRGDARLLFTILATAVFASVITVTIVRLVQTGSNNDGRLHALEQRVQVLETLASAEAPEPTPVVATAPIATPPDVPDVACDEVSCVLDNYRAGCCTKFRKPSRADSSPPDSLDRGMIGDAMVGVHARIMACGEHPGGPGTVTVAVAVTPGGEVSSTSLVTSSNPALGACVARAMARMHFPRTVNGGRFKYPFTF